MGINVTKEVKAISVNAHGCRAGEIWSSELKSCLPMSKVKQIHHSNLDKLVETSRTSMHKMLEQAYASGALSEEMYEPNYLLPKAIVTIFGRKESFGPMDDRTKKEVSNLEHFV